jgi:hypothetical protein
MIASVVALFLAGAAQAPSAVSSADLPQIFQEACLDGEARLAPGSASAVGFEGLPGDLKHALGAPTSAQVWRLNTEGAAYLYILDYPSGAASSPRVCGLAADEMDTRAAQDTIERRVTGRVSGDYNRSMEWLSPESGYRALVTRTGKFRVVQVDMLSDAQRNAAMKAVKQLRD